MSYRVTVEQDGELILEAEGDWAEIAETRTGQGKIEVDVTLKPVREMMRAGRPPVPPWPPWAPLPGPSEVKEADEP